MDRMLGKKINLLIHLAKIDGKFDDSERAFLQKVLSENGLQESYLDEHREQVVEIEGIREMSGKTELLYWALKLIHADQHLHPAELSYARIIASRLGFRKDVIDYFTRNDMRSLGEFSLVANGFKVSEE